MYTSIYETRYGDYMDFKELKPGTLLDIIQDISIKDSTRCGYSLHTLRDMNMAWLLQGINVFLEKPLCILHPLEVSTAVKSIRGASSERGCIVKQNGEVVAKTIANWFIFDTEKMRPGRIPGDVMSAYTLSDFDNDEFFSYRKPELKEASDFLYTVKITRRELDTNKHLNNQKGAEILIDALPIDFSFNSIRLLYKKSAYLGDELKLFADKTPKGYLIQLFNNENELCIAGSFETI